jgi:hypothetical protein
MVWAKHGLEETDDGAWKYWDVTTLRNTAAHRDSDNGFQYYIDGRTQNFTFTGGWTTSQWVPVIGRWTKVGSVIKLNIADLTLTPAAQSGTWGTNTPGSEFWVGCRITASSEFFTGKMAWFSLFSAELSDAATTQLLAGAHPADYASWIDSWPLIGDTESLNGSDALTLEGDPDFDADTPTVNNPVKGSGNHLSASDSLVLP